MLAGWLISFIAITGYTCWVQRLLRTEASLAIFVTVPLLTIALFCLALTPYLYVATIGLIALGVSAGLCQITKLRRCTTIVLPILLLSLAIFALLYPQNMHFSVIDEYVYWGILGKYLWLNNHLPDASAPILAQHLSYTPGLGLWHYFFFQCFKAYSPDISYYAQNLFLLSGLCVVVRKDNLKISTLLLSALVIVSFVLNGSIFAKLSVDYLLAAYCFAILYVYFGEFRHRYLLILPALCCLFLIKQIGIFLSFGLIAVCAIDSYLYGTQAQQRKALICFFVAAATIILLKMFWSWHWHNQGFHPFIQTMTLAKIKAAILFWQTPESLSGIKLYLHGISLGAADRLGIPYIFWFGLTIFLCRKIVQRSPNSSALRTAFICLSIWFAAYLFILYFFEVISLSVGSGYQTTVGLSRYLNILFSPIIMFAIVKYLEGNNRLDLKLNNKHSVVLLLITATLLISFRAKRFNEGNWAENEYLSDQIQAKLSAVKPAQLCFLPGKDIDNYFVGLRQQYYMLPHAVSYKEFATTGDADFLTSLKNCDYLIAYKVDNVTQQHLAALGLKVNEAIAVFDPQFNKL